MAVATDLVSEVVALYKQWMIDGMTSVPSRSVVPAEKFVENMSNRYALKNTQVGRFLMWEDDQFGIDMRFSDGTTDATGKRVQRWFFTRGDGSTGPIKYGDTIAIGYGTSPSYVNFEQQTFGVNLGFQDSPSREWKILGGDTGTQVKTNEPVALFNMKSRASATETGEFLIHCLRPSRHAPLGWPTSECGSFWDRVKRLAGDAASMAAAAAAKALLSGGK